MKRHKIKYLGIAEIAGQLWCHQKAKFYCFRDEQNYKAKIKEIKWWGGGLNREIEDSIKDRPKVFKKSELCKLTFSKFLKSFKYSLVYYADFLEDKNCKPGGFRVIDDADFIGNENYKPDTFRALDKKVVLFYAGASKIVIGKGKVYQKLRARFNEWKQKVRNIKCEYLSIVSPSGFLPWDLPLEGLIVQEDNKAFADGVYFESVKGNKYPTQECFFKWHGYFIVGIPDGIAKKFCYEFKTVKNDFAYAFSKRIALAQATLYSYFFKKPYVKVQFYFKDTGKIKTIYKKIDKNFAMTLLETMDGLIKDKMKPIPPKRFKCRNCEFKAKCKI